MEGTIACKASKRIRLRAGAPGSCQELPSDGHGVALRPVPRTNHHPLVEVAECLSLNSSHTSKGTNSVSCTFSIVVIYYLNIIFYGLTLTLKQTTGSVAFGIVASIRRPSACFLILTFLPSARHVTAFTLLLSKHWIVKGLPSQRRTKA